MKIVAFTLLVAMGAAAALVYQQSLSGDDTSQSDMSEFVAAISKKSKPSRRLAVRPVRFYAMGDAPYSSVEKENFPLQIAKLDPNADFAVHLGDMKGRSPQCKPAPYNEMATMLKASKVPMFIIPGDNDYYDCLNRNEGFKYWSNALLRMHENWSTNFNVRTQPVRPENFAVTWQRVLFISVHTLWTRQIKDQAEWTRLENDNIDWTRNQLTQFARSGLVDAVVILAQAFPRPTLYPKYGNYLSDEADQLDFPFLFLQGDAHRFHVGTPFRSKKILRVIVDRGGIADPLKVTVDLSKQVPFIFERRPLSGQ